MALLAMSGTAITLQRRLLRSAGPSRARCFPSADEPFARPGPGFLWDGSLRPYASRLPYPLVNGAAREPPGGIEPPTYSRIRRRFFRPLASAKVLRPN